MVSSRAMSAYTTAKYFNIGCSSKVLQYIIPNQFLLQVAFETIIGHVLKSIWCPATNWTSCSLSMFLGCRWTQVHNNSPHLSSSSAGCGVDFLAVRAARRVYPTHGIRQGKSIGWPNSVSIYHNVPRTNIHHICRKITELTHRVIT